MKEKIIIALAALSLFGLMFGVVIFSLFVCATTEAEGNQLVAIGLSLIVVFGFSSFKLFDYGL